MCFFFSEFPGWRSRRGTRGARREQARQVAIRRNNRGSRNYYQRRRLNPYEMAMKDVANTAAEFFFSLTNNCRDNIRDSNYRPRDPHYDEDEDGASCG